MTSAQTFEAVRRRRLAPELLQHELELAREVQESLLPVQLPALSGLQVAALNRPARIVSGDVYDVVAVDESRMAVLCADVSGKGFGAALLAAEVQSYFRAMLQAASVVRSALAAEAMSDLVRKLGPLQAQVVTLMNTTACRHLDLSGRYATLFFGEIDSREGTLRYVNAGHNPPLLLPRDGPPVLLSTGGPPVGLFEDATYETGTEVIPPQGRLLIYTDGVIEARDGHDEEFGLQRLTDLCAAATGPLDQLLASILEAVENWNEGFEPADDLTLVAVAREG